MSFLIKETQRLLHSLTGNVPLRIPYDQSRNVWILQDTRNLDIYPELLEMFQHDKLLKTAEKAGIIPITFNDILKQLGENYRSWVLFDQSVVSALDIGNHWLVIEANQQKNEVTLSFCGRFGVPIFDQIVAPFTVSTDQPFFTGMSVQKYYDTSTKRPFGDLVSVNDIYEKAKDFSSIIGHKGEDIYFSEGAGPYLGLTDFNYIRPSTRS